MYNESHKFINQAFIQNSYPHTWKQQLSIVVRALSTVKISNYSRVAIIFAFQLTDKMLSKYKTLRSRIQICRCVATGTMPIKADLYEAPPKLLSPCQAHVKLERPIDLSRSPGTASVAQLHSRLVDVFMISDYAHEYPGQRCILATLLQPTVHSRTI